MASAGDSVRQLLVQRAALKSAIRQFFAERDVLEVDVPAMAAAGVTDPNIENIVAKVNGRELFLQSSPEYGLKRLLTAGSGDIYSLNYAYRDSESGDRHRPEFLMLEWYRTGWDEGRLMEEVAELFRSVGFGNITSLTLDYGDIFAETTGLDPLACDDASLQSLASQLAGADFSKEPRSTCLDLLFGLLVEPELPGGLVFVRHYPACQQALARLDTNRKGQLIARRFEAFYDRLETANGYYEITNPEELRERFAADQQQRSAMGKPFREIDQALLAAMGSGLPACAGVALGVDRLLMQLLGKTDIAEVLPLG